METREPGHPGGVAIRGQSRVSIRVHLLNEKRLHGGKKTRLPEHLWSLPRQQVISILLVNFLPSTCMQKQVNHSRTFLE